MSTTKILFLSIMLIFLTSACSKDWFRTYNGNMPTNERVNHVKVGMSKNEVEYILGVPSNIISLDKNTWLYMSSEMEQMAFFDPKEIQRDLLVIKFDQYDQVSEIKKMTKTDGKYVDVDSDRTKSVGKEQGFFEKYFGGVGQYSPMGIPSSPGM